MQKILPILFILLFPCQLLAADYDAFILNFLRVKPMETCIHIDMSLGTPQTSALEKALKEGQILKFTVSIELIRERFLRNKAILSFTKEYYLQYEPLARQFMVSEWQYSPTLESPQEKDGNWLVILRNSDPHYLFETLVHNLHFQIPSTLEHNKHYIMTIHTNIKQVMVKNWAQKNLFFLENDVIQPAKFTYEFDF